MRIRSLPIEPIPKKFLSIASTAINLDDDDRPYLFVKVHEEKYRGLMDSGSQSSVMNEEMCERVKEDGIELLPCDVYIRTADGTSHKALGYMNVPYLVRGIRRVIPTLVVRECAVELILGMDFWKAYRIRPCFVSNTYDIKVINGGKIAFQDPNEIRNGSNDSFESDITPPKCINVEVPHDFSPEDRSKLDKIVESFPFCKEEGELNKTHLKEVKIETGGATPHRCKLRIDPPWKLKKIIEEIERLEKRGIIRKVECSEWLQPVMAVPKPNGKWRICLDARWLNAATKKNCYPQQNANRILSLIGKAKYISTIDMTDAYFQLPLHPDSQEKTAFAVPTKGTYVYNRMPMGLTNSGAELCSLIDSLFGSEFEPHVFPYLDDIVVVTETFEQHLEFLEKVANKFKYANLTISPQKSKFGFRRLKYLGHIIDEEGVGMDKSRIEAIESFPTPRGIKEVQRLIGLAGWYRRFIRNFAELTAPITELIKKGTKFKWNDECQKAFEQLIIALTTAPVLACPDYNLPFEIQADASKVACGAVLVQYQNGIERVIAYMSQKFTPTQQKYHVTELECLAVILAIEKFRPYIEGSHFRVITDHHSLLWLKNLKDPNGRLARWSLRLQAYDYTLIHRKGKFHVVPDALSRNIAVLDLEQFPKTTDSWYIKLKENVVKNPQEYDNLKLVNDLVYIRTKFDDGSENSECLWRLCIPKEQRLRVMKDNHDDKASCHLGKFKTLAKIRKWFFWPKMREQIEEYVRNCELCKITKAHTQITTPPAGQFVEAKRPWRVVATDICGGYARTKRGNKYLFVAIDVFSKFTVIKPARSMTASAVTEFFKNEVILKFACPEIIVTDNGKQYRSVEFSKLAESRGIHLWYTALYYAQANPTECVNKTIVNAIRTFITNDLTHQNWDENIQEIANAINNSVHTSTGETPYEINFGQKMAQHAQEYTTLIDANSEASRDKTKIEKMRQQVQQRLNESREKYIKRYNLRTRPIRYEVGELVFRENTILSDAAKHITKKLAPKRIKCQIVEKTGTNTYILEDCQTKKRGEFHASKFCK